MNAEMVGTWDIRVTLRNCETGASIKTLRAMNTFACGGTLIETGAQATPNLSNFGHGAWRHIGGQSYRAVLLFFRFNQDGTIAEMQKITRHIELSDDGKEFTSTASLEDFDADDSLIRTNCATETARRLE
jgi:hypothetical protein